MFSVTRYKLIAYACFLHFALWVFFPPRLLAQGGGAKQRLILAVPSQAMSMMPFLFAAERGFFKEQGLEPLIVSVAGQLHPAAMASGEIDYSAAVDTTLRASIQGMPFKVVAYSGSKLSVSLIGSLEVKSVRELKGRAIAVTSLGGNLEYLAREILAHDGLNPDRDVRMVALSQTDSMLGLETGSIQGAMLVPPFDAIMMRKGLKRLVFAGDIKEYPQGGLATTDKKIRENPAELKRMIRAVVKTLLHIHENRDSMISYTSQKWKIDQALAAASYETMIRSFSRDGTASTQSIQNVIESTRARLKLQRAVAPSEVVNLSLLEEVRRELGLK